MADKPQDARPQGWRDVQLTDQMPLVVLVNFLNVLNQRLCAIEDVTQVPYNNQMVSLTEFYAIQAEEERKQMEAAKAEQKPADNPQHINEGE